MCHASHQDLGLLFADEGHAHSTHHPLLCTGELNAIRKHKCFLCSPFYGRACREKLKPKGPTCKGPSEGSWAAPLGDVARMWLVVQSLQGLLESKDTRRPWGGPMFLSIALPEDPTAVHALTFE